MLFLIFLPNYQRQKIVFIYWFQPPIWFFFCIRSIIALWDFGELWVLPTTNSFSFDFHGNEILHFLHFFLSSFKLISLVPGRDLIPTFLSTKFFLNRKNCDKEVFGMFFGRQRKSFVKPFVTRDEERNKIWSLHWFVNPLEWQWILI